MTVVSEVVQVPGIGSEPGVENLFVRLMIVRLSPVVYCHTAPQAIRNASTIVPTQTALTVPFCSLRPKKNMSAAPRQGTAG